ncbi:MAG TPA: hypothetical protein VF510_04480 [Ktedonobacterales bacterium]
MLKVRAPGSPWYTAVILILFAMVLAYGFVKGDPVAFLILAVLFVFFGLPLLLLFVLNRRSQTPSSARGNGTEADRILSVVDDDPSLLDDRDSPDSNN